MKNKKNSIIIYTDKKSGVRLETHLENESVWLTQKQMSQLFNKDVKTINEHIRNVYRDVELIKEPTIRKFQIVQKEGTRTIQRDVDVYNLDVVISVGYRVKSLEGTKFRIWATDVLKKHIVDGYTINENRLLEANNKFRELQNTISFIQEASQKKALDGQSAEILNLLSSYSKTLTLLNEYDKDEIKEIKGEKTAFKLTYENCKEIVGKVRIELINKSEAGDIFGNEKDNSFESTIKNLYQTYDGKELYQTIQSKASHLLYLMIKNHPFTDGNKRIGSFLFVYFLDKTNSLYKPSGEKKINDNALTALALLVAESDPKDKDILVKMIKNLLV